MVELKFYDTVANFNDPILELDKLNAKSKMV